jgi:DNA-binding response OmpR family regulator
VTAAAIRAVASGNAAQIAEIAALQTKIADLEDALGMNDAALYPRQMSPCERKLFGVLLRRASASKDQLMQAIYAGRNGADMPNDPDNVFKVMMSRLRRRLRGDAIEIETVLGDRNAYGVTVYRINADGKAKAKAIMAGEVA